MQIIQRINNKNSHYQIQLEDTDERVKGIYLFEKKINSKTKEEYEETNFVSTLIYPVQKIRSENAIFYKIIFFDEELEQTKIIKSSDLLNDSFKDSDDFKYILDNGLIISYKYKAFLIDFLKCAVKNLEAIEGTDKTGWRLNEEHKTYDYVSNGFNTSNIIFTGTTNSKFETKGSKEQYLTKLKQLYQDNSLVFAITSYCASGFILHFLRNEMNQILGITGLTSKGKSTVGKLALSMFTNPKRFKGMDATKLGMSLLVKDHIDNFIFFDENQESDLTSEKRLQLIYSLANATERTKAKKFGDEYKVKEQDVKPTYSILIAGEKSFLNGISKSNNGLDARYLEIILPSSMKLWDSINTSEESEKLNQFILDNYGFLTEPFLNYIRYNHKAISERYDYALTSIRAEFKNIDALTSRKVRILAYTFVTSSILAEILYGDDFSTEIADNAYKAFKLALFSEQATEIIDVYKDELNHIENTLQNNFEIINKVDISLSTDSKHIRNYFGFIEITDSKKLICITTNKFTDFCRELNFDEKLFLMYAKEKKILKHEEGKNTKKIQFNKQRASYYVFDIPFSFFDDLKSIEETKEIDLLDDNSNPFDKE